MYRPTSDYILAPAIDNFGHPTSPRLQELTQAWAIDIGAAMILSGGAIFLPQKLDDHFSVVVLNTHAKTAKLTTPNLQLSRPAKL